MNKKIKITLIILLIALIAGAFIHLLEGKNSKPDHAINWKRKPGKAGTFTIKNAPKEMATWIEKNAQVPPSFKWFLNAPGWYYVNWNNTTFPTLNKNTPYKINIKGEAVAKDLNKRFMTTTSHKNKYGDFTNTGVFVHGWDSLTEKSKSSLFIIDKPLSASTFLRADITKDIPYPIFNGVFNRYALGQPQAGVIYKKLNKKLMVFCSSMEDIGSGDRYKHCDNYGSSIKKGLKKSWKKEIDQAWKQQKSVNTCKLEGINTVKSYLGMLKKRWKKGDGGPCVLGGDQNSFNIFIQASLQNIKYHKPSSIEWNEVALRILDKKDYVNTVEAIFYMYSKKNFYYIAPQGKLKKYNVLLGKAQFYQKQLFKRTHIFKPIIAIDMDALREGKPAFHYFAEDQAV